MRRLLDLGIKKIRNNSKLGCEIERCDGKIHLHRDHLTAELEMVVVFEDPRITTFDLSSQESILRVL